MSYGAISTKDAEVLEGALAFFAGHPVVFVEVGTFDGRTARGARAFCEAHGSEFTYWGVDVNRFCPTGPFPGANYVIGRSEEVFDQMPKEVDVVFIDGCHCVNHVLLDAIHYGSLVKCGGFILFHDAGKGVQGVQTNHWVHPKDSRPIVRTEVHKAIQKLGWPNSEWRLHRYEWDSSAMNEGQPYGGMIAFQRL